MIFRDCFSVGPHLFCQHDLSMVNAPRSSYNLRRKTIYPINAQAALFLYTTDRKQGGERVDTGHTEIPSEHIICVDT